MPDRDAKANGRASDELVLGHAEPDRRGAVHPHALAEKHLVFMGTSVEQIDRTYGHLLPDTLERARTALDAYLALGSDREALAPRA
jgi:hypothetical protein